MSTSPGGPTSRSLEPFDANRYRKTVLAKLLRDGVESSDPFEIYDLPLAAAATLDDRTVEERVATVWAFWQKSREHPKYGGLVTALLAGHSERAAALLDRSSRTALAGGADRHRAEVDASRFLALDAAIERLVERFGGVPENKVEGLEKLAAASGIDRAEVAGRLTRVTVLRSRTAPTRVAAPPPAVLRQVRADLDEVGQLSEQPPPPSLHAFLGLPPDASPETVRRRVEALSARNRERRPDRLRAVLDDLLTAATRLLVDGDPDAYLDALVLEVAEALRPQLAAAVLVEDTLLPDDATHLVSEAQTAGLDSARAHAVVARLAAEAGQPMPSAAAPTTTPAPAPAATRPPGRSTTSRSPLGRDVPPPASAWHETLSHARRELRAGRLREARRQLETARQLAGEMLPPLRAVADEIDTVAAEVAARWTAVLSALPARRHVEALVALDRLLVLAAEEPGPHGEQAAALQAESRRRVDAADAAVAAVRGRSGPDAERTLLAVLSDVADHPGALESLNALGVAPVASVRAERSGASVVVRWDRSPSAGDIRYKVTRIADARVVGRTPALEIEDGSAPSGALGVYEVVAVRAGISSPPARTDDPVRPPEPAPVTDGSETVVLDRAAVPVAPPATSGPPELELTDSRGRACLRFPTGLRVVRDDGAQLREIAPGLVVDPAPRSGRSVYLLLDGDRELARGDFVVLPSVTELRVDDDRLCFTWPPGCTEVVVEFGPDGVDGMRKVTNSRYSIDGGVPLPEPRPHEVAVRSCVRADGELLPATGVPRAARLRLA